MTNALVKTLQAQAQGRATRTVRVTVTQVTPLQVRLPDQTVVPALAVTGLTYTVGGAAVAFLSEPGIPVALPVA